VGDYSEWLEAAYSKTYVLLAKEDAKPPRKQNVWPHMSGHSELADSGRDGAGFASSTIY